MKSRRTDEYRWHTAVLVFLFVLAVVAAAVVLWTYGSVFSGPASEKHDTWGQFGDYVGGTLNPLFALIALFALLYTIKIQVSELRAVRNELEETTKAAQLQTFENTFFQMLRLHHHIVDSIKAEREVNANVLATGDSILVGRDAFPRLCQLLDEDLEFGLPEPEDEKPSADHELESVRYSWASFFSSNYPSLSHYFRNFYNILRFVHDSKRVEDKERYTRILRAQLSAYELKLLFYNGVHSRNERFKELAVEYALFEQIRVVPISGVEFLSIDDAHFEFYDQSAYGDAELLGTQQ